MTVEHVIVAVPARDEEETLAACLESVLVASAHVEVPVTVVVVLDGCVDASAEIARGFAGVLIVERDHGNVGRARQDGVAVDAVVLALAAARDVLGPAALAFDESLARRCADLELYVAQYHRGRDDASLARHLPEAGLAW